MDLQVFIQECVLSSHAEGMGDHCFSSKTAQYCVSL